MLLLMHNFFYPNIIEDSTDWISKLSQVSILHKPEVNNEIKIPSNGGNTDIYTRTLREYLSSPRPKSSNIAIMSAMIKIVF